MNEAVKLGENRGVQSSRALILVSFTRSDAVTPDKAYCNEQDVATLETLKITYENTFRNEMASYGLDGYVTLVHMDKGVWSCN